MKSWWHQNGNIKTFVLLVQKLCVCILLFVISLSIYTTTITMYIYKITTAMMLFYISFFWVNILHKFGKTNVGNFGVKWVKMAYYVICIHYLRERFNLMWILFFILKKVLTLLTGLTSFSFLINANFKW